MFLCNKTYFNINSEIINDIDLPYNHFYLWWSMFLGCQTFSGSLGRYFVGSQFGIILINILQMPVYIFVRWVYIFGQGFSTKAKTLVPHEQ